MARSLIDLTPAEMELAEEAMRLQRENRELTRQQVELLKDVGQYARQNSTYYKDQLDSLQKYIELLRSASTAEQDIGRIIEANAQARRMENIGQQQAAEEQRRSMINAERAAKAATQQQATKRAQMLELIELGKLLKKEQRGALTDVSEITRLEEIRGNHAAMTSREAGRLANWREAESIALASTAGRLQNIADDAATLANQTQRSADATEDFNHGVDRAEAGFAHLLSTTLGVKENIHTGLVGGIMLAIQSGQPLDGLFDSLRLKAKQMLSPEKLGMSMLTKVYQSTLQFMKEFDRLSSDFRKNTGIINRGLGGIEQRIVSIQRANLRFGVSMDEAFAASNALISNMAQFSHMTDRAQAKVLTATTIMQQFGVSAQTTAEIFNNFSKGLGYSADQLQMVSTQLMGISSSLRIPPQIIATEFNSASRELAKYGSDMMNVFKGLAEQAKRTGVSFSSLLQIASQFDTFERAGDAVGRLNAILGGPYFNAIQMLYATESERIQLMREGIRLTGRQFSSMERFEQQAIANAAGITDMSEAMRLFGGTDAEFARMNMSMAEMQARAAQAQSVTDKFQQVMMSLAIALGPVVELLGFMADGLLLILNPFSFLNNQSEEFRSNLGMLYTALMTFYIFGKTKLFGFLAEMGIAWGAAFGPIGWAVGTFAALYALLQVLPNEVKGTAKAIIGLGAAIAIMMAATGQWSNTIKFALASAAIGAVASVSAAEVTSYASGTGIGGAFTGPALVAEAGRELIQDPQGNIVLAESPQIIQLEQGTQVINNQNTEKIIQGLQAPRSLPPEVMTTLDALAGATSDLAGEVRAARDDRIAEASGPPIYITMNGKTIADLTGRRLSRNSRLTLTRGSA